MIAVSTDTLTHLLILAIPIVRQGSRSKVFRATSHLGEIGVVHGALQHVFLGHLGHCGGRCHVLLVLVGSGRMHDGSVIVHDGFVFDC